MYCLLSLDDCAGGPCQNGATCVDNVDGFTCICIVGFTGLACEVNIGMHMFNRILNAFELAHERLIESSNIIFWNFVFGPVGIEPTTRAFCPRALTHAPPAQADNDRL